MMQPVAISGAGGEAHLVGSEKRGDRDVAPGLQLSVGLRDDARAQLVEQQCLLGLGEADLPGTPAAWIEESGEAPVPPSWPAISTRSAFAFETPAATVPTPTSATSLTETWACGIGAAQVVDQLLKVLDRVDVVMGRRRDQADAGVVWRIEPMYSSTLPPGQLAALAGLGALSHLDLQLVGVDEVVDRYAEATGGDLLDRRAPAVAVGIGPRSARGPRRPRRCWSVHRGGSSRLRASREPRARSSPRLIAPVQKRRTISCAGSTSSSPIAVRPAPKRSSPRSVARRAASSLTWRAYSQ